MKRTFCDVEGCENEVLMPYNNSGGVELENTMNLNKTNEHKRYSPKVEGSLRLYKIEDDHKTRSNDLPDVCLGCRVKLLRALLERHEVAADAAGVKQLSTPKE